MNWSKFARTFGLLGALVALSLGLAASGGAEPAAVTAPPAPPPFQPQAVEVALGTSGGTVTLMTTEAGKWMIGEEAVATGHRLEAGTGVTGKPNVYELTLADGAWTVEYRPESVEIKGTGLMATPAEDGSGYAVEEATLPASGVGDLVVGDARYRVAPDAGGELAGARYDLPMAGKAWHENAAGDLAEPKLSADDAATGADETGTALEAVGAEFSMADLLRWGDEPNRGSDEPDKTVAEEVAEELGELRDQTA